MARPANQATGGAVEASGPRPFVAGALRRGVMAALRAWFNFLALNLALLVVSLPVVTVPVAVNAATVALNRWREDGEDRVVREFLTALRSYPAGRTTVVVGTPIVAAAVAADEVHYFARGGSAVSWICLGFGVGALLISVGAIGYVLALWSRRPSGASNEVWSLAARVALDNLPLTGPLFLLEWGCAALLGLVDPGLALIGLPLALLTAVRWTASFGVRRAALKWPGEADGLR